MSDVLNKNQGHDWNKSPALSFGHSWLKPFIIKKNFKQHVIIMMKFHSLLVSNGHSTDRGCLKLEEMRFAPAWLSPTTSVMEASFSSVSAALRHRDKSHISVTPTYGISVEFDRSCKNVTEFPLQGNLPFLYNVHPPLTSNDWDCSSVKTALLSQTVQRANL